MMYYIQKGSQFLMEFGSTMFGAYQRLLGFKTRNEAQSFIEARKETLDGSQVLTMEQAFEELIR